MKSKALHWAVLTFALTLLPHAMAQSPATKKAGSTSGKATVASGAASGAAAISSSPTGSCDANAVKSSEIGWDPSKLESYPAVSKAAAELVGQLSANFDPNEQAKDWLGGSELPFVYAMVATAVVRPDASRITAKLPEGTRNRCYAAAATADMNKQTGAPSGADGTTSTTELTGIPELLSVAVENGAVTNSVNGSTMTLSTSLYGLLTGFHWIQDSSHEYNGCFLCVRLGASATFNIADASDPLASATRKQVSQWQLKYSFLDQSIRSPKVQSLWDSAMMLPIAGKTPSGAQPGPTIGEAASTPGLASMLAAAAKPKPGPALDAEEKLEKTIDAYFQANSNKIAECVEAIKADTLSPSKHSTCQIFDTGKAQPATQDGLATLILQGLDSDKAFQEALGEVPGNSALKEWTRDYQTALTAYNAAVTRFEADVDNLSKGFNADLTFGQQFPTTTTSSSSSSGTSGDVQQRFASGAAAASSGTHIPDYLVGGLDLSWQPKTTAAAGGSTTQAPARSTPSVTFNAKTSFYTNPNVSLNEKTFRGVQTALQAQWTLGRSPFVSDPSDKSKVTVSASGSYQRLSENKDQAGKRPDMVLGSAKLTIPFPGGISFPVAVTFGNAQQQQAKGAYVVGNFGISFDADKLAALLALRH